jgi:hypothetical protein
MRKRWGRSRGRSKEYFGGCFEVFEWEISRIVRD